MTIQEKAIEQLERVSKHLASIGEKEDYTDIAIQALEKDKINAEIQKLRGCSCSCSDGIIDDVEDILDKLIESGE